MFKIGDSFINNKTSYEDIILKAFIYESLLSSGMDIFGWKSEKSSFELPMTYFDNSAKYSPWR